jgi:hypothetical protein
MAGWLNRFLAAIGVGGRKTEADVSYDPAVQDGDSGRTPEPGGSGQNETSGKIPR